MRFNTFVTSPEPTSPTTHPTGAKISCPMPETLFQLDDGLRMAINPSECAENIASTTFSSSARALGAAFRDSLYRSRSLSRSRSRYPAPAPSEDEWYADRPSRSRSRFECVSADAGCPFRWREGTGSGCRMLLA